MTETLFFILGLLIGGIISTIYFKRKRKVEMKLKKAFIEQVIIDDFKNMGVIRNAVIRIVEAD